VTGITQTGRNFGATLGLVILGAILLSREKINVAADLVKAGVPRPAAQHVAATLGTRSGGARSASGTFLVALIWLPGSQVQEAEALEPGEAASTEAGALATV